MRLRLPGFGAQIVEKQCVLGLRPETIAFTEAAAQGAIPRDGRGGNAAQREDRDLALTARGREILCPVLPYPRPGRRTRRISQSTVGRPFLFDKATGQRILPSELASKRRWRSGMNATALLIDNVDKFLWPGRLRRFTP